ncbi:hypothetical protein BX666DRAFT_1902650 [Dichotomocladium elegans]|nr:hypothetical protein BX666DRAFT_1902650 [Dichotomocladium elegans]
MVDQHLLLAPQDTTTPTLYHHYLLHIKHEERSVKYALCPVEHWVPDEQADSCQHLSCQTVFTLFTRRHHCRR